MVIEVDFRLDYRLFHFSFWYTDGHPQATVVLFPCSLSQGFEEATMGFTLFHFILFLAPRSITRGGELHIQVSAGDEPCIAGDGDVSYGRR